MSRTVNKNDIPSDLINGETISLDAIYDTNDRSVRIGTGYTNVYKVDQNHDGLVYVEKFAVLEDSYVPTPLGTKATDKEAFLIKEQNFVSIGGGLQTYEKHFATIPTTWSDYAIKSYRSAWWGAINYRNIIGGGSRWDKTRFALAKCEHRYFYETDELESFGVDRVSKQFCTRRK